MWKKFIPSRTIIIIYAVIILVSILSYGSTIRNDFTYDDHYSIVEAKYLHNLSFLNYVFTKNYFRISNESSYRPAVTILNGIEYTLFTTNPAGYHIINITLHILCSLLIFHFVRSIGSPLIGLICAIIHSLHPGLSESVVSPAFAEDLLCMIFMMISLILSRKLLNRNFNIITFTGIVISFACALGSKEMAFFYPFGFLILLPFMTKNRRRGLILFSVLCLILAGFMLLRFIFFANPNEPALNHVNGIAQWFGAIYYLPDYLRIYFFPNILTIIYPVKSIPPVNLTVFLCYWIFFIAVLSTGIYLWIKKNIMGAGLLWFLAALVPVSGITPLKFPFAERYLYVPSLGLHIVCAYLIAYFYNTLQKRRQLFFVIFMMVLFTILIVRNIDRTADWQTDLTLWQATSQTAPHSPAVHYMLGKLHQDNNNNKEAEKSYRRAVYLNEDYLDPYINLATIYIDAGQLEKALAVNMRALSKNPKIAIVHLNNAIIYKKMKRADKEYESYLKAIKSDPRFIPPYEHLALWYLKKQQIEKAVKIWQKAIRYDPHWIGAYVNIYKYYYDNRNYDKASDMLNRGLRFNPHNKKLRLLLLRHKTP